MRTARITIAAVLVVGLAAPSIAPFIGLFQNPVAWSVWVDYGRIGGQVLHTFLLAVGAILVAVPVGTVGGVLLARVPFFGRRVLVGSVVIGMFIPLPVYAVAWQVILSGWVAADPLAPGAVAWRPWAQGLLPAAWVHGTAAVPWVMAIVAAGLATADRRLEEDALLMGGPWAVVRRVLIPRAIPAAAVGALWVAVLCATEIAVTDAMMVQTVAEEAYTQLAIGYRAGAAAAAAVTLPFLLAAVVAVALLFRRLEIVMPAGTNDFMESVSLPVDHQTRIGVTVLAWSVGVLLAGMPLVAIVRKAAGGGSPNGADAARFGETLGRLVRSDGFVLGESILTSAAAGLIAAALAWLACGLATRCNWLSLFLLVLCVTLWLVPGPLVGFGLKQVFDWMMTAEDLLFNLIGVHPASPPVRSLVYDQPSPVPVVWAAVVRLFPLATAVVWPAVRAIPRDLLDLAAVDGLGVAAYFRQILAPAAGPAFVAAAVAVAALALGEVSAGKVVAPPGYRAFVLELFAQMHYGTDATVCGLCLIQLATIAVIGLGFWTYAFKSSRRTRRASPSPLPIPPVRPG